MPPPPGLVIRDLAETDSFDELTELIHRAYADLKARGLNYVATWQPVETTRERARSGHCLVAELAGKIVGTVTWYAAERTGGHEWFDRPDVASFGQFCVDPSSQGNGIATALLHEIEDRARNLGAAELACDTAEPATDLIAWYEHRGYRRVGNADWRPTTNYPSVVLSKRLS